MTQTVQVVHAKTGDAVPVVVKSPVKSEVNWAQIIGAALSLGTLFGLDVSPEQQASLIVVIQLAVGGFTVVRRTFFNTVV